MQRVVNVLKTVGKYDIAQAEDGDHSFNDTHLFEAEKKRIKESLGDQVIAVTELPKFK